MARTQYTLTNLQAYDLTSAASLGEENRNKAWNFLCKELGIWPLSALPVEGCTDITFTAVPLTDAEPLPPLPSLLDTLPPLERAYVATKQGEERAARALCALRAIGESLGGYGGASSPDDMDEVDTTNASICVSLIFDILHLLAQRTPTTQIEIGRMMYLVLEQFAREWEGANGNPPESPKG